MSGFIYRDFGRSCGLMVDGLLTLTGNHKQTVGKIGLGWPSGDEIETAKSMGVRCVQSRRAPRTITRSLRNDLSMHGHC